MDKFLTIKQAWECQSFQAPRVTFKRYYLSGKLKDEVELVFPIDKGIVIYVDSYSGAFLGWDNIKVCNYKFREAC